MVICTRLNIYVFIILIFLCFDLFKFFIVFGMVRFLVLGSFRLVKFVIKDIIVNINIGKDLFCFFISTINGYKILLIRDVIVVIFILILRMIVGKSFVV